MHADASWLSPGARSLQRGSCSLPVKHTHEGHAQDMRQLVGAWSQRYQGRGWAGTLTRLRHLSLRSTLLRVGWKVARCCSRMSAQLPVPRTHTASTSSDVSSSDQRVFGFCLRPRTRKFSLYALTQYVGSQNANAQCAILHDWRSSTPQAISARYGVHKTIWQGCRRPHCALSRFVVSA